MNFLSLYMTLIGFVLVGHIAQAQYVLLEGDSQENFIVSTHHHNGYLYMVVRQDNFQGAIIKKDYNGNTIWHQDLADSFYPSDVTVYQDSVYFVGYSGIFNSSANSIIGKIHDQGNSASVISMQSYDHYGREQFSRIINHPTTPSHFLVQHFYAISGVSDDVMMIEMDSNFNIINEVTYQSGDDQFWTGLKGGESSVTLLGNMGGVSSGCYVELNPDLTVNESYYYNGFRFATDYVDISSNRKVLVGYSTDNKAVIMEVMDDGNLHYAFEVPELQMFRNLSLLDYNPSGVTTFLVNGNNLSSESFVMKIAIDISSGTAIPSIIWTKYIDEGSTSFIGSFSYTESNQIVYSDIRSGSLNSFGGWDYLLAITDMDFNTCATKDTMFSISAITLTKEVISISYPNEYLPSATALTLSDMHTYSNSTICNSYCIDTLDVGPSPISDGEYVAESIVISNDVITTGNDVDFHAGNAIYLDPGFEVPTSSIFEAYIEGCCNSAELASMNKVIIQINSSGVAVTQISNFDIMLTTSCNSSSYTLSFSETDPLQTSYMVDCSNLGINMIKIYIWSNGSIINEIEGFLQVLDGAGYCP